MNFTPKRATRNFSRQGRFYEIRTLQYALRQKFKKIKPHKGKFQGFFSQIPLKLHMNGKFNLRMDTIRPFFPKSRHFFLFWKKSRPPPIPSLVAPDPSSVRIKDGKWNLFTWIYVNKTEDFTGKFNVIWEKSPLANYFVSKIYWSISFSPFVRHSSTDSFHRCYCYDENLSVSCLL